MEPQAGIRTRSEFDKANRVTGVCGAIRVNLPSNKRYLVQKRFNSHVCIAGFQGWLVDPPSEPRATLGDFEVSRRGEQKNA